MVVSLLTRGIGGGTIMRGAEPTAPSPRSNPDMSEENVEPYAGSPQRQAGGTRGAQGQQGCATEPVTIWPTAQTARADATARL